MRWSKTQEPVFMHLAGNTRARQTDYWKHGIEQSLESYHINSGGEQTLIHGGLVVRAALVYGDSLGVVAVQGSVYPQRLTFSLLVWVCFFTKSCKSRRREPDFLSVMGNLQDCSTQHIQVLLGPCKDALQICCWVMVPSKKLKIVASPRVYAEQLLQTQEMCTEIVFVCMSRYMLCSHTSHTSTLGVFALFQQLEVCS